jgi:hypothetical protein
LASPLSSTPSAGYSALQPLFGNFSGTMRLSDFPRSFITVVLPWDSQHGPPYYSLRPNVGPPGSRVKSFGTCAGSLTTQGPATSRDSGAAYVAFHFCGQRRHPEVYHIFRGSIALPALPLSTLRLYPYEYKRMTRGRCGSLCLHRMELSSTTLHRFSPALSHNILVRHEGARCQRVQDPSGKLSVHPGSYPDSGIGRPSC